VVAEDFNVSPEKLFVFLFDKDTPSGDKEEQIPLPLMKRQQHQ